MSMSLIQQYPSLFQPLARYDMHGKNKMVLATSWRCIECPLRTLTRECVLYWLLLVGNSILLCVCGLMIRCKTSGKRVLSPLLHKIEMEGPRAGWRDICNGLSKRIYVKKVFPITLYWNKSMNWAWAFDECVDKCKNHFVRRFTNISIY